MLEKKQPADRSIRQAIRYWSELREELDLKIKQLPPSCLKQVKRKIKERRRVASYEINIDHEEPQFLSKSALKSKLEIIATMYSQVKRMQSDVYSGVAFEMESVSPIRRHANESRAKFRYEVQTVRPTATVVWNEDLHMGRSKILQVHGVAKSVTIKANVSPAWKSLISKLGGAIICGHHLVVTAAEIKRPFHGGTIYLGELLSLKGDPKVLHGYFGIFKDENGNRITVFGQQVMDDGDGVRKTERALRVSVAKLAINEMTT